MRITYLVLSLVATLLLLAGCATQREFAEQVVKTNLAVEDAHNRVLLLNVVRAFKQHPMHFTGFAKITGPAGSISPTFAFTIPFGPDFTNNVYTFSPTIRPDVASYEIAVYDKQEFVRGVMTPVTPKVLQYFLDQGWPAAMILHLFIRKIDVIKNNRIVESYVNEPQDRTDFDKFTRWAHNAALCDIYLDFDRPTTSVDLVLGERDLPSPASLLAMQEKGYSFTPKVDPNTRALTYELQKTTAQLVLKFRNKPQGNDAQDRLRTQDCPELTPLQLGGRPAEKDAERKAAFVHLRSPEAMVYYLGELARAELVRTFLHGDPVDPRPVQITIAYDAKGKPAERKLFSLAPMPPARDEDVLLSVHYEGETYGILRDIGKSGRSMHVLSLLNQVIGLQKSATELPQTTTVRIVQ